MEEITTTHLVLGEDINHHHTLFAGRAAEWFVEAGYLAATRFLRSNRVVCAAVHELSFRRPVPAGEAVSFRSFVVWTGRSSLICHVSAVDPAAREAIMDGFIRFVLVDENGRAAAHGRRIEADTEELRLLQEKAAGFSHGA